MNNETIIRIINVNVRVYITYICKNLAGEYQEFMLVLLLVLECFKKSGAGELNVATIRGIQPHWSSTVGMFGLEEERSVGIILWHGTIIQ